MDWALSDDDLLKNKVHLTKICYGVYFLFQDDEVVYIGSSSNCNKRIRDHVRNGLIRFNGFYIQQLKFPAFKYHGYSKLNIELYYINRFKPKYNKQGNPDYYDGKTPLWFEYISQDLSFASIAKKLNIDYVMAKNIIEGKRKRKDKFYWAIFNLLIKDPLALKKFKEKRITFLIDKIAS